VSTRSADGYVRVSRRAGREGESFIAPDVQRKKISDWAALHDVEIVRWWEEIEVGILTLIAELELERIKDNWSSAVSSAVGRGIHISARTPVGDTRADDKRLVLDPRTAPVVAEVFRGRALGASWAELARYLEEQEVYPSTGNKHWSKYGVTSLVKNPSISGKREAGRSSTRTPTSRSPRAPSSTPPSRSRSRCSRPTTARSLRRPCSAGSHAAPAAGTP
jgi:DNA invertase Pin-like site-specific DNA recombinase